MAHKVRPAPSHGCCGAVSLCPVEGCGTGENPSSGLGPLTSSGPPEKISGSVTLALCPNWEIAETLFSLCFVLVESEGGHSVTLSLLGQSQGCGLFKEEVAAELQAFVSPLR